MSRWNGALASDGVDQNKVHMSCSEPESSGCTPGIASSGIIMKKALFIVLLLVITEKF